jgi:hypothetical protein
MRTVVIRLRRADLSAEMAAMRAWLDENRCQPSRFDCDQYEDTTVLRLEFKRDSEAQSFRARFEPSTSPRHPAKQSVVNETHEQSLVPEGWSPSATGPESMLQVCRWRIMAEEIRTEAEDFSTASAKETLQAVAQVWDQMAENLEKRLTSSRQLRR